MDDTILRQRARELRTNSTDAERYLWYFLRAKRFGYKFKRQVPIKNFIVDFVCSEKRLIIELDGSQHQTNQAYDALRTAELQSAGFKVLRFWNTEVLLETTGVLETIRQAVGGCID
jgi:very-short-patch-repair endonuclease